MKHNQSFGLNKPFTDKSEVRKFKNILYKYRFNGYPYAKKSIGIIIFDKQEDIIYYPGQMI